MWCSVCIVCSSVLSCSNLKLPQTLEVKNIFKQEIPMLQLTFFSWLNINRLARFVITFSQVYVLLLFSFSLSLSCCHSVFVFCFTCFIESAVRIAWIKDVFRPYCCLRRLATFTSLIPSLCCYGFFLVQAKHPNIFFIKTPLMSRSKFQNKMKA